MSQSLSWGYTKGDESFDFKDSENSEKMMGRNWELKDMSLQTPFSRKWFLNSKLKSRFERLRISSTENCFRDKGSLTNDYAIKIDCKSSGCSLKFEQDNVFWEVISKLRYDSISLSWEK